MESSKGLGPRVWGYLGSRPIARECPAASRECAHHEELLTARESERERESEGERAREREKEGERDRAIERETKIMANGAMLALRKPGRA